MSGSSSAVATPLSPMPSAANAPATSPTWSAYAVPMACARVTAGLDDGERTIYVGTLNKLLFPGVRMGYAVVPPALLRAFVNARYLMDRHPPSLGQTVAAEFMRQGHFAGHIRRVRLAYRDQRDALVSELRRMAAAGVTVDAPDQGKHLIAYLDRGRSDVAVEEAALRRGVVARAISRMYRKAPPRSGLGT